MKKEKRELRKGETDYEYEPAYFVTQDNGEGHEDTVHRWMVGSLHHANFEDDKNITFPVGDKKQKLTFRLRIGSVEFLVFKNKRYDKYE